MVYRLFNLTKDSCQPHGCFHPGGIISKDGGKPHGCYFMSKDGSKLLSYYLVQGELIRHTLFSVLFVNKTKLPFPKLELNISYIQACCSK